MTRVEFFDHEGRITGFCCSGHSGYAEAGGDVVCAAVSTAVKLAECTINDVLGEHAFEYFLRNKHQEWDEYRKQVTPFELKKYLPKL